MQLSIFVATWGRTAMIRSRGIASFLDELSARGFAGVEATAEELGASLKERVEYCRLLQARGLRLIYAAYTSWLGYEGAHPGFTTPPEHLAAGCGAGQGGRARGGGAWDPRSHQHPRRLRLV